MRRVTVSILLVLLLAAWSTPSASAADDPSVSVSPSTGLRQGTSVAVSAAGLPSDLQVAVVECDQIYDSSFGSILQDCPALTYATTTAGGTLSVQVSVVERTSRREAGATVPVDCRGDGCRMFVTWPDPGGDDRTIFVGSGTLDFASAPPVVSVSVSPSTGLADVQRVLVTGTFGGAAGRTVEVVEHSCFTVIQGSGCYGELPVKKGTVRADDTFAVSYLAHRFLSDGSDCTKPDDFLSGQCRISVFVLDSAGQPDDTYGVSSQGDPGAAISFAGPTLTVSPSTGLTRDSKVTLTGSGLGGVEELDVILCDYFDRSGGRTIDPAHLCPRLTSVSVPEDDGAFTKTLTLPDVVLHPDGSGAPRPVYCRDDGCHLFLVSPVDEDEAVEIADSGPLGFTGSSATLKANPTTNLASPVKWTTLWGHADGAQGHTIQVVEQACYPYPSVKPCYGQLPVKWGKVKSDGTFVIKYPASRYLGDPAKTDCTKTTTATCRITLRVLDTRGVPDDSFGVSRLGQPSVEITFRT